MKRTIAFVFAVLAGIGLTTLAVTSNAQAAPATSLKASLQQASPDTYAPLLEQQLNIWARSIGRTPALWENIPVGQVSSPDPCSNGGRDQSIGTLWFCPLNSTIYIGYAELEAGRKNAAWYDPIDAIGHEYGHFLQQQAKSLEFSENQADCVGGAFARWLNQHKQLGLNVFDPHSVRMIERISRPFDVSPADDPHGTFPERAASTALGFSRGISACNIYDLAHPLV